MSLRLRSGWKLILSVKPPRSLSLGLGAVAGKSLHSAEKGTSKQKPTGWVSSQRFPGSTQNRAQYGLLVHLMVRKCLSYKWASLVAQRLKRLLAIRETWVRSLSREAPLEKQMAIHSSILAWRIPWTEKPGGLQSMGFQRLSDFISSYIYPLTEKDMREEDCFYS